MPGKTIRFLDDEQWPSSCLSFDLALDQEKTALCVIDMQNYCIAPSGALVHSLKLHDPELFDKYRNRVEKVVDQTRALLSEFRRLGRPRSFRKRKGEVGGKRAGRGEEPLSGGGGVSPKGWDEMMRELL